MSRVLRRVGGYRLEIVLPLVLLVAAVLGPAAGLNRFWQSQVILMVAYILVVCGVNLSFGYAGELALGQIAVFAVGAYVSGWLAIHGADDLLVMILAAAVAGALVGLLSGLPGLRIGGWALAMTSFFLVVLIPDLVQLIPGVGGSVGLSAIPPLKLFGKALGPGAVFVAALVILGLWLGVFRNLVTSRHGIALKMLRESRDLTAAVGSSVYRLKLMAYVGGAIPAAVGGVLYATHEQFVGPTTFSFTLAIGVIAGSVIGGADSVYGAVVGGALLEYLDYRSAAFVKYSLPVYGAVLLVGGVLVSGGLAFTATALLGRVGLGPRAPRRSEHPGTEPAGGRTVAVASGAVAPGPASDPAQARPAPSGRRLEVSGITKSFGGVTALRDVTLSAEPGAITAVIGPNGSGKTTLLNVVAGVYRPDSGTVSVDGVALTSGGAHLHARGGISRTFQSPIIPRGLLAWEVVAAARYQEPYCSITHSVFRTPRARRVERQDRRMALQILGQLGLLHVADEPATTLSLGHRRLLEVGRALARESSVILLDEAASGLDEADLEVLSRVLQDLRVAGATIVLVEHNFPLVVGLADIIYVLELGQLIATGDPAAIQQDPHVILSYLGEGALPQSGSDLGLTMEPER